MQLKPVATEWLNWAQHLTLIMGTNFIRSLSCDSYRIGWAHLWEDPIQLPSICLSSVRSVFFLVGHIPSGLAENWPSLWLDVAAPKQLLIWPNKCECPAGNYPVFPTCEASIVIITQWSVTLFEAIFLKYSKMSSQSNHVSSFDMISAPAISLFLIRDLVQNAMIPGTSIIHSRALNSSVLSI